MLKRYPGQEDIIDCRLFSAGATGFVSARGVTSRDGVPKAPIGQWLSTYVVLNCNSIDRLSACMHACNGLTNARIPVAHMGHGRSFESSP